MNLPGPVGDMGNSSIAVAGQIALLTGRKGSETWETLICGVDQHHRYPMVSPGCRLVDLRVNIKGSAELGAH